MLLFRAFCAAAALVKMNLHHSSYEDKLLLLTFSIGPGVRACMQKQRRTASIHL